MSKKNEGKIKFSFLLALIVAFAVVSVQAYTVSRKVDSGGTQIYLLEDSGNMTVGGTVTSAGAQTITAGGLTLTAGDLTVTAGDINSTLGDLTLTAGDITSTLGDFTMTSGNALLSSGTLTLTAGDATLTAGDLNLTAGSVDLTAGWISEGVQDVTLTAAAVLTPSSGYITLNSDTGIITNTIAASATIPLYSHLYLHNDGTGTVTFLEAGTYVGAGSLVLAAEDTAHVMKTATNVYTLIGLSNN